MTQLLNDVFKKVSALPPEEQDRFAADWLAQLEDEKAWDEKFAETQDVLTAMAEQARKNFREGKTINKGWDEI